VARKKDGVNRSEEIRQLYRANPKMTVKEAVSTLADRGIKVGENLVYFVKGKLKGQRGRRKRMVSNVAASTGTSRNDAVATIRKVKGLAAEVGGLNQLKALVEALTE
jgi:hypothetical protein